MIHIKPGNVKARIINEGLTVAAVAARAGVSPQTLANYMAGRRRDPRTQSRIRWAFTRLTGQRVSPADFWGALRTEPLDAADAAYRLEPEIIRETIARQANRKDCA